MRLIATIALLAYGLGSGLPALAETNVGVTAAVNQDAKGIIGSNIKTISLGDSVVFNQRIETGAGGLVQVLLADGTTFMVGPNSDLVIDSFVYDPNAGTAQVAATFTKGVLRFIGGQTSKTEGGVTINTPVGTMGIRGAMVDVVLDPPPGTPPHVDMLFGNEVTLEQGQQLLGRLYAAGYSLALGQGGVFEVLKTPPGWGSQIQAALAGAAGTKGGAPKGPSDSDVKNSEVAQNNSGNGPGGPPLSPEELKALLEAAAKYDELRNFILNNQHVEGYVGGMFVADNGELVQYAPGVNDYDVEYSEYSAFPFASYEPTFAKFAFDAEGNPIGIEAAFLAVVSCECDQNGDLVIGYSFDGSDGQLSILFTGDDEPTVIPTSGDYLFANDDPREDNPMNAEIGNGFTLADTLDCESCDDFIRWGFWGFNVDDLEAGDVTGDVNFAGTWISGDLTTRAQLTNLADADEGNIQAFYRGDAVGVVHNANPYAETSDYVATGDMTMGWTFGERKGFVNISNFDASNINLNVGYEIYSPTSSPGFVGEFAGDGFAGSAQGAFVNDGNEVAAGVVGNWNYYGYDFSAGGVFMGERYTPN